MVVADASGLDCHEPSHNVTIISVPALAKPVDFTAMREAFEQRMAEEAVLRTETAPPQT